jgi:pyruvate dehydrogenase E1 component
MTRRYIDAHFGAGPEPARFIALVGDAELDEGNVWEAIADAALQGLGNVMWVVDANRQSLDRVIPGQKIKKLMEFFDGSGWHVVEAKYGSPAAGSVRSRRRRRAAPPHRRDEQRALPVAVRAARRRPPPRVPRRCRRIGPPLRRPTSPTTSSCRSSRTSGGHDLGLLLDSVPGVRRRHRSSERRVRLHGEGVGAADRRRSAQPRRTAVARTQIDELRAEIGLTTTTEWDRFDPRQSGGARGAAAGADINNPAPPPRPDPGARRRRRPRSEPSRSARRRRSDACSPGSASLPAVAERIVTLSPDVSVSTNLGGWINKFGVFHPEEQPDYLGADRLLRWQQGPTGRHIELGISEMNLFLALHALGLGHELHGEHLLPIGTVYDPFVCRGLDA